MHLLSIVDSMINCGRAGIAFLGAGIFLRVDSQARYCPVYCLFLDQNGAYWIDSIDWIDRVLKA
jgi:hypothetical protein